MHAPRSIPVRLAGIAAVGILALTAAACSSKGGAKTFTDAQLRAALPTAADVGTGYKKGKNDKNDPKDPANKAIDKACPDAEALINAPDDPHDANATFDGPMNKSVIVGISRDVERLPKGKVDAAVKALNDCTAFHYTDKDGSKVTGHFSAKRDDSVGDYGLQITIDETVLVQGAPQAIAVHGVGKLWVHGNLGGSVLITSGVDVSTLQMVPADVDKLGPLTSQIDGQLAALTK